MAIHSTLTSTTAIKTTTQPTALYYLLFSTASVSGTSTTIPIQFALFRYTNIQLKSPRKWFPLLELHIAY